MKLFDFNKLLENTELREGKIKEYTKSEIIKKEEANNAEIKGHVAKAEHNLSFIQDNIKLGYYDWCITGCYYATYHAALALLLKKGFITKNHDATLCLLMREYYKQGMTKEEIELVNKFFLDYQDLLFYELFFRKICQKR
ncbi:HEPN domain-containing protein [Candidatus Woesearchaeota archaeon]|nr:HEPN domain-containing protein [Candidatus Woesearchaeota archaeon]